MRAADSVPIAVIGFSSAASPLEPAWPSTHRALLPIAGKPVIVHLVEQLARDGIRHLRVAGSIQQYAVRQRLGDGAEWGVTIRYSDLHGGDLILQTLLEHGHCLYLCGDQLHIGDFTVLRATGRPRVIDPAERTEQSAYWTLWPIGPACCSIAAASGRGYVRDPLVTAGGYHAANLHAATADSGLLLPGYAVSPGVHVDWDSHIGRDAGLAPGVTIGKHCRIDRRVHLGSGCVVGNGSIVGRDSRLANVSVLPNTFIGAGTRLRDAVVTPLGLFDLAGGFLPTPDPAVIGRARGNAESRTGIPSEKLSVLEPLIRRGRPLAHVTAGSLFNT